MDGEFDFSKYDDRDMVDMFGRLDARYSPINCARLKELLTARGYVVQDGQLGPGSATPSAEKLRELIGTPQLLESRVDFSKTTGPFRWLEPAQNDFGLVGSGTLLGDGLHLQLAGRRGFDVVLGALSPVFKRQVRLDWRGIVNVETAEDMVHISYQAQDSPSRSITLVLPDHALAGVVAAALPKTRTSDFRPGLREHAEFGRRLRAQSPRTPAATLCLLIVNALTYLICALAGDHWLTLPTPVLTEFGSNFGPFTADGDWWRLLTSMFLHLGLIHLAFNMWALASFGPLTERLYGSINYLVIYLLAGIVGSLGSISWRPEINSVGASGAIFGILGALLAAQARGMDTIPRGILRPLRNMTLLFIGLALFAGFTSRGSIDNGAHLGGLAAGILIGLAGARPVSGERGYRRGDLLRLLRILLVALSLIAAGLWAVKHSSSQLAGEGAFWRAMHWTVDHEKAVNEMANELSALHYQKKLVRDSYAEKLETEVEPFWREVNARFSAIQIDPESKYAPRLELLRTISAGRARGYAHLAVGLQRDDLAELRKAKVELRNVEDLLRRTPEGVER